MTDEENRKVTKLVKTFGEKALETCANGEDTFDMSLVLTATGMFIAKCLSFAEKYGDADFDKLLNQITDAIRQTRKDLN